MAIILFKLGFSVLINTLWQILFLDGMGYFLIAYVLKV